MLESAANGPIAILPSHHPPQGMEPSLVWPNVSFTPWAGLNKSPRLERLAGRRGFVH
jgi:hypothetical protein